MGATIADVEHAAAEHYGRANMWERGRSPGGVRYVLRVGSRKSADCTISQTPDGILITMSPYCPTGLLVVLILLIFVGLIACIVPGLAIIIYEVIYFSATSALIERGMPTIVNLAEHQARLRSSGLTPVVPTTTPPPPPPPPPLSDSPKTEPRETEEATNADGLDDEEQLF